MIFPEHALIFFHVPRSGGTSVEQMLAGRPLDASILDRERLWGWDPETSCNLHHATVVTTLRLLGQARFDAYAKLAVVRDPFSRMVSAYYYNFPHYHQRFGSFKGYVEALPDLIETPTNRSGHHETPEVRFTHLDGEQVVDTILRFEDLPGCMDVVRTRLGITEPLPRVNETRYPSVMRKPTEAHYDGDAVDIVRRVYAEDFRVFGYPDTPASRPAAARAKRPFPAQ